MSDESSKSLDIFGVKPVADAVSCVTKAAVEGAAAFLGRICLPAAEEIGLLFQDKVKAWRAKNALAIVNEAEARFEKFKQDPNVHAHPRLVAATIEHGSWIGDKTVQDMWAGLLSSSCSPDGKDESNLIFINLLSQLTSLQVRVLNYACENVQKTVSPVGLIIEKKALFMEISDLQKIAGTDNIHRLDRELDYLRSLELIHVGFQTGVLRVNITPSALALNLYVRCQGFTGSPVEYFGLAPAKGV